MSKTNLFIIFLILLLIVPASNLDAQERENQFREMEQLYEHAMELAENGQVEESRRVMEAVNEMRRAFNEGVGNADDRSRNQTEARESIEKLEREREELKSLLRQGVSDGQAAEIREELEELERAIGEQAVMLNQEVDRHPRDFNGRNERLLESRERFNESREHRGDGQEEREHQNRWHDEERREDQSRGEDWESRMHHLRAAAGHLHEAGLHELAEQVEIQIGELENERHGSHGHGSGELEPLLHRIMERMDDLNRQIDDLREEVGRLKR